MSSQHTVAVSISSAQRNRSRWPNPNKYEVTLPMAMQRVRQVVLAGIDVPLHQRLIEGEGAFLPFAEGLTFEEGAELCVSWTDSGGHTVHRTVTFPPPLVPMSGSPTLSEGYYTIATASPHGLPTTSCGVGAPRVVGQCAAWGTYQVLDATTIRVPEDAWPTTESFDLTDEELYIPPLHVCEVAQLLSCALAEFSVDVDPQGRLRIRALRHVPFELCWKNGASEVLGFGPCARVRSCETAEGDHEVLARSGPCCLLARIPPGNYDAQTMGGAVVSALNCLTFREAQSFLVRNCSGSPSPVVVMRGQYTPATLCAALTRALIAACDQTFTVTFSSTSRCFTVDSPDPFALELHLATGKLNFAELLEVIGFEARQYCGGTSYCGNAIYLPWVGTGCAPPRHLYALTSGHSTSCPKTYCIGARQQCWGELCDQLQILQQPLDELEESLTLEQLEIAIHNTLAQLLEGSGLDQSSPDICVLFTYGADEVYMYSHLSTRFEEDDVVCIGSPALAHLNEAADLPTTFSTKIAEEHLGKLFKLGPNLAATLASHLKTAENRYFVPARLWSAMEPRFELRFAGCVDNPLIRRLGFAHEYYCGQSCYESCTPWDMNPYPCVLMQLGTPTMGFPWKFSTVTGQMVPYFTALGTSTSNYSRTYQDSNDYKTSGSITVGVVHVEFLNPDMTPYHFHGCDHCINLVFVCEGDQALLSCA